MPGQRHSATRNPHCPIIVNRKGQHQNTTVLRLTLVNLAGNLTVFHDTILNLKVRALQSRTDFHCAEANCGGSVEDCAAVASGSHFGNRIDDVCSVLLVCHFGGRKTKRTLHIHANPELFMCSAQASNHYQISPHLYLTVGFQMVAFEVGFPLHMTHRRVRRLTPEPHRNLPKPGIG